MGALMSRLERQLQNVEAGAADEIRRYHLNAQLRRLAVGVAGAVLLSILNGGPGPLDWRAIVPIALAALVAQARAIWPTIPLDLILKRLGLPGGTPATPSTTAAPGKDPAP